MSPKRKRLLVLAASTRKTNVLTAPAIERYLGAEFFVVRRHLRRHPDDLLVIWILSARYGLMTPDRETINDETAMSAARAEQLRERISRQFVFQTAASFAERAPSTVFVHLPPAYLNAFAAQIDLMRECCPVWIAEGPQWRRSKTLKGWLEGMK